MMAVRRSRIVFSLAMITVLAAGPLGFAEVENLPERMDAPEPRPAPAEPKQDDADEAEAPIPPDDAPRLPASRPAEPADAGGEDDPLPGHEATCRARLRELGADFSEHAPIAEPEGCAAPHPLLVSTLPGDVALRPPAVLTCAMAEATALFVRDHAAPLVEREFGSPLAAIDQVSSYVCRPRNGTDRLSEHAFANALDWGALVLADGAVIDVRAHRRAEPRRARLIAAIREAACGPFRTVLGPGSDADHADHFHFDLAERRGGATWCQ